VGDVAIFCHIKETDNLTRWGLAGYKQRAHDKKFMEIQHHGFQEYQVLNRPVWGITI
jgi:hypothetical protein